MAICKRCQSENHEQTRFCTFCGGRMAAPVRPLGTADPATQTPGPASPPAAAAARAATAEAAARSSLPHLDRSAADSTAAAFPDATAPADPEAEKRYVQKVVYQHFSRAKQLIRERDFDGAIGEFQLALQVSPGEPTITQMLAKTQAAQKLARAARQPVQPVIPFKPASETPHRPRGAAAAFSRPPAPTATPMAARKPATEQWLTNLRASPSITPSAVLDTPTHETFAELTVSLLILGGVVFFAWLLMI